MREVSCSPENLRLCFKRMGIPVWDAHSEVMGMDGNRGKMHKKSGYMFTNRKHPTRAVMATILGCISLISLVLVVYFSYLTKGMGYGSTGMTGFLITLFSAVGLLLGILTVMEKERYLLFPVLGILLNLIALAGISLILYAGASLAY